jgi:hypothetical protein
MTKTTMYIAYRVTPKICEKYIVALEASVLLRISNGPVKGHFKESKKSSSDLDTTYPDKIRHTIFLIEFSR